MDQSIHPMVPTSYNLVTFTGLFRHGVDSNHRLTIPADWRPGEAGALYVGLIFIAAWGSDTGAYFLGIGFGKRKLAPRLSPKKTLVGAIGGLVTSAVLCAVYAFILYSLEFWTPANLVLNLLLFAAFGIIGSALGQAGDLVASAIKRHVGVKDYGRIIPGHGGVLDRFDSILFVAPFALIFFYFVV